MLNTKHLKWTAAAITAFSTWTSLQAAAPSNFRCSLYSENDEQRAQNRRAEEQLVYKISQIYVDGERLIISTRNDRFEKTPESDTLLTKHDSDGRSEYSNGRFKGSWDGEYYYDLKPTLGSKGYYNGTFVLEQDFEVFVSCTDNDQPDMVLQTVFDIGNRAAIELQTALYDLNYQGRWVGDFVGVTGLDFLASSRGKLPILDLMKSVAESTEDSSANKEQTSLIDLVREGYANLDDIGEFANMENFPGSFAEYDMVKKPAQQAEKALQALLGKNYVTYDFPSFAYPNVDAFTSVYVSENKDRALVIYWNVGA